MRGTFPRGQGPDRPKKGPIAWKKFPLRRCLTLHTCALCPRVIKFGEDAMYYDGGYGRRAHKTCVDKESP